VFEDGHVRVNEVELVARNGRDAWIKTSLKVGTKVVAYPPTHLNDGDRVRQINR
jgi:HlyD family secretion protein